MLTVLTVGWSCSPRAPEPPPPPDPLAVVRFGPLTGAQWGVLAVDLATGETLLAHDPERRMIPGSAMKLLTTVAALDLLGPDYRWETTLLSTGSLSTSDSDPLVSGVTVDGDLIVAATGDPTLSARWWDSDSEALQRLAESLDEVGIRRVSGALVVDASMWDSVSVRPSWMVEDLPVAAGASGGAFALAEGETHIEVRGGPAPGDSVTVRWWPFGEDGFVRARLDTGSDTTLEVEVAFLPESRALELTGSVPVGRVDTLSVATRDPVRQAAAALHRAIAGRGVAVEGGWRVAWAPGEPLGGECVSGSVRSCDDARPLRTLPSPTLLEIVAATLGTSQNWIAEQIIRSVGGVSAGRAAWPEGTDAALRHVAEVVGVDPQDFKLVDGSGLSVQNLATPRALVRLLTYARGRPWGDAFRAALAEPSEADATLEDRLAGLEGRVFAKTGTLTNVSALAGYLLDAGGREVAFAILVNGANLPAVSVRDAIDAIVRRLASGR